MMKYKEYLCNNGSCQKHFRRKETEYKSRKCRSKEYCSLECCIEDFEKTEGSLDDYAGCEKCIGGQSGSWASGLSGSWTSTNHISIMCEEPIWGNIRIFFLHARMISELFYPERPLTTYREFKRFQKLRKMIDSGTIDIRQLSLQEELIIDCFIKELKAMVAEDHHILGNMAYLISDKYISSIDQ